MKSTVLWWRRCSAILWVSSGRSRVRRRGSSSSMTWQRRRGPTSTARRPIRRWRRSPTASSPTAPETDAGVTASGFLHGNFGALSENIAGEPRQSMTRIHLAFPARKFRVKISEYSWGYPDKPWLTRLGFRQRELRATIREISQGYPDNSWPEVISGRYWKNSLDNVRSFRGDNVTGLPWGLEFPWNEYGDSVGIPTGFFVGKGLVWTIVSPEVGSSSGSPWCLNSSSQVATGRIPGPTLTRYLFRNGEDSKTR